MKTLSNIALEQRGYKYNRWLGNIFTYCPNCKRYTYFYWMDRNSDNYEVTVCKECNLCDYKWTKE